MAVWIVVRERQSLWLLGKWAARQKEVGKEW